MTFSFRDLNFREDRSFSGVGLARTKVPEQRSRVDELEKYVHGLASRGVLDTATFFTRPRSAVRDLFCVVSEWSDGKGSQK